MNIKDTAQDLILRQGEAAPLCSLIQNSRPETPVSLDSSVIDPSHCNELEGWLRAYVNVKTFGNPSFTSAFAMTQSTEICQKRKLSENTHTQRWKP